MSMDESKTMTLPWESSMPFPQPYSPSRQSYSKGLLHPARQSGTSKPSDSASPLPNSVLWVVQWQSEFAVLKVHHQSAPCFGSANLGAWILLFPFVRTQPDWFWQVQKGDGCVVEGQHSKCSSILISGMLQGSDVLSRYYLSRRHRLNSCVGPLVTTTFVECI